MKGIVLKSKKYGEMVSLYDDLDHELISKFKWYVFKNGNHFYAMSTTRLNGRIVLMHRLIMGVIDDCKTHIDHINRAGLDNTRNNLRIASKSQNAANSVTPSTNKTGYKGVTTYKNKFRARIWVNGRNKFLGTYGTKKEAALKYNESAIKHFGEYACINNVS